jgi:hypothetical protein
MKLILILFAAATLTGCGAQRTFNAAHNFAKNNCVASAIKYDPQTMLYTAYYECSGLWEWREGRKHIVWLIRKGRRHYGEPVADHVYVTIKPLTMTDIRGGHHNYIKL